MVKQLKLVFRDTQKYILFYFLHIWSVSTILSILSGAFATFQHLWN